MPLKPPPSVLSMHGLTTVLEKKAASLQPGRTPGPATAAPVLAQRVSHWNPQLAGAPCHPLHPRAGLGRAAGAQDLPAPSQSPEDSLAGRSSVLEQHSRLTVPGETGFPGGTPCPRRTELARKESFLLNMKERRDLNFISQYHGDRLRIFLLLNERTHKGNVGM